MRQKQEASLARSQLQADLIVPDPFDWRVTPAVAVSAARVTMDSRIAGVRVEPQAIANRISALAG